MRRGGGGGQSGGMIASVSARAKPPARGPATLVVAFFFCDGSRDAVPTGMAFAFPAVDSSTSAAEFAPGHDVFAVELAFGDLDGHGIKASRLGEKLEQFNPAIHVFRRVFDQDYGDATRPVDANLASWLSSHGPRARPGDTIMITLSSHGKPSGFDGPFEWGMASPSTNTNLRPLGADFSVTAGELMGLVRTYVPRHANVAIFTTACHSGEAKEELIALPHNLLYVYAAEAPDTASSYRKSTPFIGSHVDIKKTAFQIATELMFSHDPAFSASKDGRTIRFATIAAMYDRAIRRAGVSAEHQDSFGGALHKPAG